MICFVADEKLKQACSKLFKWFYFIENEQIYVIENDDVYTLKG